MGYLWIKTLHIVFVASWFAGLFYLPRLFVNMAKETQPEVQAVLNGMAHRLYRFMTILAIPAVVFGLWMYLGYGVGMGPGSAWMHVKLLFVLLIIGYHHGCGVILKKFDQGKNTRSHVFYRWFNEIPVLMMLAVTALVVIKPA